MQERGPMPLTNSFPAVVSALGNVLLSNVNGVMTELFSNFFVGAFARNRYCCIPSPRALDRDVGRNQPTARSGCEPAEHEFGLFYDRLALLAPLPIRALTDGVIIERYSRTYRRLYFA